MTEPGNPDDVRRDKLGRPIKPRTEKQRAALAAGRAKARARQAGIEAVKKGVDMTSDAQPVADTDELGAPNVVVTPYQAKPKRAAKAKPEPVADPLETEPEHISRHDDDDDDDADYDSDTGGLFGALRDMLGGGW